MKCPRGWIDAHIVFECGLRSREFRPQSVTGCLARFELFAGAGDANGDVQYQHHCDQHQHSAPGQLNPCGLGAGCVFEDLYGKRGEGMVEIGVEEGKMGIEVEDGLIGGAGREEEGSGFSSDARDGQHDAGDDSGRCRRQDDAHEGLRPGRSQSGGCLAQGFRDQFQHLFRRAGHDWAHDESKPYRPRPGGIRFHRNDHELISQDTDNDGGDAGQHIHDEPDGVIEGVITRVFGEIDAAEHPDRDADETRQQDQSQRSGNTVTQPDSIIRQRTVGIA